MNENKIEIIKKDLWKAHDEGYTVCVFTNSTLNSKGEIVMGGGLALEAKKRFPELPKKLAEIIDVYGNRPWLFEEEKIITFPTKTDWRLDSSLELIDYSMRTLWGMVEFLIPHVHPAKDGIVLLPIPGIGLGNLKKEDVLKIITPHLLKTKKIILVEK